MLRLHEGRTAGAVAVVAVTVGAAAAAAVVGGACGAVDSAEEDSDSESDWEELPDVGLFDPIGESGLWIR